MRLESPGLTGPPTTTRGKRKRKKKEDEESRVVYRCCSLFRRLATSKQRQRQHQHRHHRRQQHRQQQQQQQQQQQHQQQQEQQHQQQHQRRRRRRQRRQQLHGEHEDGPAARNATAFRASRHPPFRSVVRARYHAVTPTLEAEQGERRAADRLSATRPQRQRCTASTSPSRKKKGITGHCKASSIFNDRIFLRGYTFERLSVRANPANGFANLPILLSAAPSSLDVLANTAFKDDDDDDDDENDDDDDENEDDGEDETENVLCESPSRQRHQSSTTQHDRVKISPRDRTNGEIELYATKCRSWSVRRDSENGIETGADTALADYGTFTPNLEIGREPPGCSFRREENRTNGIEEAEEKTVLDNVINDDRERKRRKEGSGGKGCDEYSVESAKPSIGWNRGGGGGRGIWPIEYTTNRRHDRHRQVQQQQEQQNHYHYQQHQQLSRRSRNYGLLLLLYLLTWPLLCSSNGSGQHPSPTGFGQNLVRERNSSEKSNDNGNGNGKGGNGNDIENENKRNGTVGSRGSSFSSLAGASVGEAQRYVQEEEDYGMRADQGSRYRHEAQAEAQKTEMEEFYRDRQVFSETSDTHPYNEYSWEVNQINPWLSACDLAGPAPADLQGSCGPPEVPKNCPAACALGSRGGGPDAHFPEVIEKLQATEYGSSGRKGISGVTWPDARLAAMKDEDEGDGKKRRKKRKKKDDNDEDDDERPAPEQCLFYLEESHKRDICRDDFGRASTRSFLTPRENRYWFMSGLRLRHCCEHAVVNALAPGKGGPLEDVLNGGRKCADALDKLFDVDALAARLHCEFEEVLARYDCAQPYSVIHNCTHCKEAYRKWVCSSLVPYFAHGGPQDLESSEGTWTRIRPCLSLCQSVEQRCPYLLPGDRAPAYPTQYAGEPTFLCRDPNIPETGEQATRALHSSDERECCFHVCSEEEPGSGICANCTDREPRKRGRERDPPTAPHCEITPIQSSSGGEEEAATGWSASTDGKDIETGSSSTSFPTVVQEQQQHQGTSLCGTGGVGTMASSGSNRARGSHVARFLCLSSILIQFFRWSWMLTRNYRRTILVFARSVLFLGRGIASFVVVVVARSGVGGARGGRGGGGGVRSIEEVRPRSRLGWCRFQWWYPSLSSSSSSPPSSPPSSPSLLLLLRSNKRVTCPEKEDKYEEEKKKKRKKKKKEDEEEEDCRGVWWRRWWWWRSWRRRRKDGGGRIRASSELLPVVIVLEVRGTRKRTVTARESRRRPRHRRRRYKLNPLPGRCRWRWKEENSARVCCRAIGGGEGAAIATPPRSARAHLLTTSEFSFLTFFSYPSSYSFSFPSSDTSFSSSSSLHPSSSSTTDPVSSVVLRRGGPSSDETSFRIPCILLLRSPPSPFFYPPCSRIAKGRGRTL